MREGKKPSDWVVFSVRMTRQTLDRLRRAAAADERLPGTLARKLVLDGLERLERREHADA